jgi:phenylacetic acid degradation operon negative regulatory protein
MKPKTEQLLYHLFWTADMLMRPTFRNLTGSFEEWAYRNGFLRRIHELERQEFLESVQQPGSFERVYRLTVLGTLRALGGRDPTTQWCRKWDGKWRFVLFDLPEQKRSLRNRLRHMLREEHFGCLQQSVWITPDPLELIRDTLKKKVASPDVLVFIEGVPCAGEEGSDLVRGAWNFHTINDLYMEHRAHLDRFPSAAAPHFAERFQRWTEGERMLWTRCMKRDPLLPEPLLPEGYLGRKAWERRCKVMAQAGKAMRHISPEK